MSLVKWIDTRVIGDQRGKLVALESHKNIPFEIKRVYYLVDLQMDLSRGFHAHKKLIQVAICVQGSCEMLLDNGREKSTIILDSFSKALLIEPLVWHEMHNFKNDCVLMVLASDHYDEEDYIRSYDDFNQMVRL